MYTYHLKNILESNSWNNKVVIEKLKRWGCSVVKEPIPGKREGNIWVTGWQERLMPGHVPPDYLKLIDRLDEGFQYELSSSIFTPMSRVSRSGRIYTTLCSRKRRFNFQSASSEERGKVTWGGKKLENFDVSASQLRIALALRGQVLPSKASPWDVLEVDHNADKWVTEDVARELKKTVALMLIKGVYKFDIPKIWEKKIGALEEFRPRMDGYRDAVLEGLLNAYPVLAEEIPPIRETPDGYRITKKAEIPRKHDFESRPFKVKTSFRDFGNEEPTENNVLEAMEAYVLRQVIRSLPPKSPVLTCHDQVYILGNDLVGVSDAFYRYINRIAMHT